MRDLITAFRRRAATAPNGLFCHFRSQGLERSVTNAEAWRQSVRYAHVYKRAGLREGEVIPIILKHAPDLYFAFLGAMLARCIPTFMPFHSPKQDPARFWSDHRALFGRIGARAVVTYCENVNLLAANFPDILAITPDQSARMPCNWDAPDISPDEIAFLQHSSGTTGLKKGVLLSHRAVVAQVQRYADQLALTEADVVVSWLPLYHDMGLIACFVTPLVVGASVVSLDAFEWVARPRLLFEAIQDRRGTHVWLPNFAFHHLCRTVDTSERLDLSGVKAFVDCSEPCRIETLEQFVSTFSPFGVRQEQCRVCYAMAETVFAVTQTPRQKEVGSILVDEDALQCERAAPAGPGQPGRQVVSVGEPLPDVELRIVDKTGRTGPPATVGEVAVKAPFLFSGYHGDPDRTSRKLRDGWYFTGDLGFLLDGELYLLGRTDDLLIINGRNVFAHDVEFTIQNEVDLIKPGRCIALGLYNEDTGSQDLNIVAEAVAPSVNEALLKRQIKAAVLEAFGLVPREVTLVPSGWLAKSTSGKLTRDLNRRRYTELKQAAERASVE